MRVFKKTSLDVKPVTGRPPSSGAWAAGRGGAGGKGVEEGEKENGRPSAADAAVDDDEEL